MIIREIISDAEFQAIWPFIKQLNPGLSHARFKKLLKEMRAGGYRCVAAYENKEMVGICGFWMTAQFFSGRQVELDNVAVSPSIQSKGLGSKLVRFVEKLATKEGCEAAFLKAYVVNDRAHKFYFREGYKILGYGFFKKL